MKARDEFLLKCGKFRLRLGRRTYVMGVLNLTPDSFSGDGIYKDLDRATERAQQMADQGADIIDVGGESTRPGAKPVSVGEEMTRVLPVVKRLAKVLKIPISIDTSRSELARACLDLGASIINDIRGLRADQGLAKLAARYDAGVIIVHIKGRPRTMQKSPTYKSLISEIIASLRGSIRIARRYGVGDGRIIVDPGIGFGKTTDHNLEILQRLREFKFLGRPIMVGTSRKSVIGNILGLPVEERGWGSAATVALAVANGAHIVRVHDVKEMVQVVRMADAIVKR